MNIEKTWIPCVGAWILTPRASDPSQLELSKITQRTRSANGSQIWLWVHEQRFRLQDCQPATKEHIEFEYQRLLELAATVGELLDEVQHE